MLHLYFPVLELTRDFAKDYLGCMIVQTLRALEPGLALIKIREGEKFWQRFF